MVLYLLHQVLCPKLSRKLTKWINPVQAKKMNHMLFFLTVGSTIFTPVTFMSSATCQRLEGKHLCRQNVKTQWFH